MGGGREGRGGGFAGTESAFSMCSWINSAATLYFNLKHDAFALVICIVSLSGVSFFSR